MVSASVKALTFLRLWRDVEFLGACRRAADPGPCRRAGFRMLAAERTCGSMRCTAFSTTPSGNGSPGMYFAVTFIDAADYNRM